MAPGSTFKNAELILPCEWKECCFVGKCMEEFCNHIAEHLEEYLQHPLETADCFSIFKGKHKLWDHLRTHTQERVVACPACGGMFSNNTKFFDHAKRQVSEDINRVACVLCDMVCTSVSSLNSHIRFRHCDERPFHCHLCDKGFKNAYDLHKHVETHNDSDAYSCDVEGCGFTSRTLQTLRQHYKRAHVSNGTLKYKCHICQKCFSWSYTLTLHLRKAHKLSSHSRFRYKEDDEGHMSLILAVRNAVTGLGQALNNKMVTNRSSPSQNSFRREGGDSWERDTSTVEVLFTQLQPWSPATGENVLVETETSMAEPVYSELQTAVQPFENYCTSTKEDDATPMNVKEKLAEMELGLGIQIAF
ncbi:unnamed protein product [Bubo scandiacus]